MMSQADTSGPPDEQPERLVASLCQTRVIYETLNFWRRGERQIYPAAGGQLSTAPCHAHSRSSVD